MILAGFFHASNRTTISVQFPLSSSAIPEETAFSDPPELLPDSLDVVFGTYQRWKGDFDSILIRRKIRILVPYSKNFFFLEGSEGKGLVYDAMQLFENYIHRQTGVRVAAIIIPVRRDQLLPALTEGLGDVVAANLTITPQRSEMVDFTAPIYRNAHEWVVSGPDAPPLDSLEDLAGQEIHVRTSSSFYEHLKQLSSKLEAKGMEAINIQPVNEYLEAENILELVSAGLIPATVVGDNIAMFWSQMLDSLTLHKELIIRDSCDIAWAIRKNNPKLKKVLNDFIRKNRKGTLTGNILFKRYMRDTAYISTLSKEAVIRFDTTIAYFKKYARQYDFDWLMMAAQGFQESGLDQNARSPAGAVGIMQLLPSTASDPNVDIPNIWNAENNIHAGIKYMHFMYNRYFAKADMDALNKHLFLLASYNAGPAKIRRMQRIAKAEGLNPNVWFNQVERIAAREISREPVQYVSNIYKYYLSLRYINRFLETKREEMESLVNR